MMATRKKSPFLQSGECDNSNYFGSIEPKLKPMVKTRKSASRELRLEPETNGHDSNHVNGVTEFMEVDETSNSKLKAAKHNKEANTNEAKVANNTGNKADAKLTMKARLEKEGLANHLAEEVEENSPEGGSMAVVLTQGLMAHDSAKVDSALRENKLEIIQATLADLNVIHVIPLLKAIEHRLRTRHATDIRPWLRWLQCTMSFHMSYLASQRTMDKEVSGLMEWLKARAIHQQKLFQLHGKLGVLVDQIEKRSNNAKHTIPQPLIIFNNDEINDSDADELDSIGSEESAGSDEDEWWDDGEIRQKDDEEDESEEDDDEELEDIRLPGAKNSGDDDDEDDDSSEDGDEDEEMEED